MSLVPFVVHARGRGAARGRPGGLPARSRRGSRPRARTPVHLPASPLMHGTGFMSSLQALTMGGTIVTLESRNFDPDELWTRGASATASRRWRSSATRSASRWCARSRTPRPRTQPYDLSSLGVMISSGVMWTAEVKEALMARAALHLPRLARARARASGSRARSASPGAEATTAKFQIGEHAKVLTRGRPRDRARLRGDRPARARRADPARLLQGPGEDGAHVPDVRRPALLDPRRLGARSRPTARSSCSAGAACRSTPAARRSSPKRSRRR